MKLCICQIIKDEHDYIEEWVEYHHNLGIDDFYLIEDLDSKSHKDILDKYDYVHLYKLSDIMNDYEQELLNNLYIHRQRLVYIIFERLWRKDYDWLFFIDVDEYIDCDKKHLFEVLDINKNNPIITMRWKFMKCDGHLYHPNNHKKYSLIDTYKTYTYKYSIDKQIINCNNKLTIYDNFTYLPHNFSFRDNMSDIELKHFSFKSFEEYINRLKEKGEICDRIWIRKINDFFNINDEYDKDEIYKLFNIDENTFKTKINESFAFKEYNINNMSFTNVQCNILYNFLNKYKPKNICEFGCGVTTDIFLDYKKENNCDILSVDHDKKYIKHNNTKIFELYENTNVYIDKDHKYINTNKYYGLEKYLQTINNKFDFICIDGPFSWNKNYDYVRIQMLDFIMYDLIDDNCIFMIHDVERNNIKHTLEIFEYELTKHDFNFIVYSDYIKEKRLRIYKIYKNIL